MPTLVGTILVLLGGILVGSGVADFKKHGGFYLRARLEGTVMSLSQTIFFVVIIASILLGGIYLLMPDTQCSFTAMP